MHSPAYCDVIDRFHRIVDQFPNQLALIEENGQNVTYHELRQRCDELAESLTQSGFGNGQLAAIAIEKSIDYIVSILAVWQAGGAFMPLDPSLPDARRNHLTELAQPAITITRDAITQHNAHRHYPPNLAYLIFTSGSTGQPKGVMIAHDGLCSMLMQQIEIFALTHTSKALWFLSTQFDASLSDMGTALLSGATLVLPACRGEALAPLLHRYAITHADLPPSMLAHLSSDQLPASLQTIIIGGEVCPPELVRQWAARFHMVNVYGPTEATICSSMRRCDTSWQDANIGKPIAGLCYHLIDKHGHAATEGELVISGDGVALGYLDQPALNAKKFLTMGGKRAYRTGDYVRQCADGSYVFCGRLDRQIKQHGRLIAPEEIESALSAHPDIRRAGIIQTSARQVIGFVESHGVLNLSSVQDWLAKQLPEWMIPACIHRLDPMPTHPSGKIDYAALERLAAAQITGSAAGTASPDATEYALQKLWQHLLQLPQLPHLDDDFFTNLGGDSLLALGMVLQADFQGMHFPAYIMEQCRTIRALAVWLQSPPEPDAEWQNLAHRSAIDDGLPTAETGALLLTGATGFLGMHLLAALQERRPEPIICLIRAHDRAHANTRLHEAADRYGISLDWSRIEPICGDVALPHLGLNHAEWQRLCHDVMAIYHCAAEVHMLASFAQLHAASLGAIRILATLAATTSRKALHYASSLSVFVNQQNPPALCLESDRLQELTRLHGGYAQSKYAAETALWQHNCAHDYIYRLGLLTGHSSAGAGAANDYLRQFLRGLRDIGAVPDGDHHALKLDITPVDYAANAMAVLSCSPAQPCYHIASQKGATLAMLLAAMRRAGIELETLPAQDWLKRIELDRSSSAAVAMALCRLLPDTHHFAHYRSMDLFQATGTAFDCTNTLTGLAQTDIIRPDITDALLDRYIEASLHD